MTEITRLMVTDVLNKLKEKEDQQVFFQCSSGTFYDNLFRPGELFALTEDNLDFSKKEIRVEKTLLYQKLEGDTGKTFHENDPKTFSSR